ncbi:MAG: hypothetical protein V1836_02155 [Candidatus Aenigmatarchaeota archaeon]
MQDLFRNLFESDPIFPGILSVRAWDENGLPISGYVSPRFSNDYPAGYALMQMAEAKLVQAAYLDRDGKKNVKEFYEKNAAIISSSCGSALLMLRVIDHGYLTAFMDTDISAAELFEFGESLEKTIDL